MITTIVNGHVHETAARELTELELLKVALRLGEQGIGVIPAVDVFHHVHLVELAVSRSDHAPTQALLDALRENGWRVKRYSAEGAILAHPALGIFDVAPDESNTERLIPFINGRQVSYRMAMQHVRGEQ